jgi:hypothetical protein
MRMLYSRIDSIIRACRTELPDDSRTAACIDCAAPLDCIARAALAEGYAPLAEQIDAFMAACPVTGGHCPLPYSPF